jgi:hypothetical protein
VYVPLIAVARNLGHRDTRMVEQHHGHLAYITDALRAGAPRYDVESAETVVRLTPRKR